MTMYAPPSAEDLKVAHALIGCETKMMVGNNVKRCPWEGVCEIQYGNAQGPKWLSCREHAAPYRGSPAADAYMVIDSGRKNRLLLRD